MVNSISPDDKEVIKELFSDWLDIQDRKSALTNENKENIDKVSNLLDIKKSIVTKLFKTMKAKLENGGIIEDEVSLLIELVSD